MTLLQLLKTCDHKMRIRIFFGAEKHYFDIADANQKDAYTEYLEWAYEHAYGEDPDCTPYVEKWNVQNITFTEWGKQGDRIEVTEKVLFIHLK